MNEAEVVAHVMRRAPSTTRILGRPQRLTGGLLNEVYRLEAAPFSMIIKVFDERATSAPEIRVPLERAAIEARVLDLLSDLNLARTGVVWPGVIDFDPESNVLIEEDLGEARHLGEAIRESVTLSRFAEALGEFVGGLHQGTRGRSELRHQVDNGGIQQARLEVQYRGVGRWLDGIDHPQAVPAAERAEQLGKRLLEPGEVLIMGDLWPPSILVLANTIPAVIDWEMAHYGRPAQDLGHLAAHLWLLGAGDFWDAFRTGYETEAGPPSMRDLLETQIHMGCEILARTLGPFAPEGSAPSPETVNHAVRLITQPEAAWPDG